VRALRRDADRRLRGLGARRARSQAFELSVSMRIDWVTRGVAAHCTQVSRSSRVTRSGSWALLEDRAQRVRCRSAAGCLVAEQRRVV
jgi:hypothetical protein